MKIKIYPPAYYYNTSLIVFSFLEKIIHEDDADRLSEYFDSPIFDKLVNSVIRYVYPKHVIKIQKHDTYSVAYTLALIIVPILKQLKETSNSHPCECSLDKKDYPKDLRGNPEEAWNYILDKMIWSFQQDINLWDDIDSYIDDASRIKEGHVLFGKYYNNLWD